MESIFPYPAQSEFAAIVDSTSHRLENYMYHVDEICRKFPNKSDGVTDGHIKNIQGEKSDEALTEIKKKLKGNKIGVFVRLLGVMRAEGDGKTKVVFNKMFLNPYLPFSLPVVLTLGYSNDRNLVDDGSGTGVLAPRFKIQPIIHLNVPL
ncbi:hypothetical protein MACJ_003325 [Theileria orientalis]|uniref:Uncharacterized protein n=1 Tax=Theileria orientalis TaxID=68886 RepID=A0A976SK20_THEOR|nr:hypothetical protein MACJ_003325 [Theileria orientalis]